MKAAILCGLLRIMGAVIVDLSVVRSPLLSKFGMVVSSTREDDEQIGQLEKCLRFSVSFNMYYIQLMDTFLDVCIRDKLAKVICKVGNSLIKILKPKEREY